MAADKYIPVAFVNAHMGAAVASVLYEADSTFLGVLIEGATASVQSAMRNNGYTVVASGADDTLCTDQLVKLAVMGTLWEMLASRPQFGVELPKDWATHPAKRAMGDILSGAAQLPTAISVRSAVGGISISDHDATTGIEPNATRDNLGGY